MSFELDCPTPHVLLHHVFSTENFQKKKTINLKIKFQIDFFFWIRSNDNWEFEWKVLKRCVRACVGHSIVFYIFISRFSLHFDHGVNVGSEMEKTSR
jgi:hypothetical protein